MINNKVMNLNLLNFFQMIKINKYIRIMIFKIFKIKLKNKMIKN